MNTAFIVLFQEEWILFCLWCDVLELTKPASVYLFSLRVLVWTLFLQAFLSVLTQIALYVGEEAPVIQFRLLSTRKIHLSLSKQPAWLHMHMLNKWSKVINRNFYQYHEREAKMALIYLWKKSCFSSWNLVGVLNNGFSLGFVFLFLSKDNVIGDYLDNWQSPPCLHCHHKETCPQDVSKAELSLISSAQQYKVPTTYLKNRVMKSFHYSWMLPILF